MEEHDMRYQLRASIIIIVLILICPGKTSSSENDSESSESWSIDEMCAISLLDVVKLNTCLQVHIKDYERFTSYDAGECGLLIIPDNNMVQISYSYIPGIANCSVWFPERDVYAVDTVYRQQIEDFLSDPGIIDGYMQPDFASFTEEEQQKLIVLMRIVIAYAELITGIDGYVAETGNIFSVSDVLLNMEEYWGVDINPKLEHETRIHYRTIFDGDILDLELYYNEILIDSTSASAYYLSGDFIEGDIVIGNGK